MTCLNRQMVYFLQPPPLSDFPLQAARLVDLLIQQKCQEKTLRPSDCLDCKLTYRRFKRHYSRPVHNCVVTVVHTVRASNLSFLPRVFSVHILELQISLNFATLVNYGISLMLLRDTYSVRRDGHVIVGLKTLRRCTCVMH